jgi:hypothetical protein
MVRDAYFNVSHAENAPIEYLRRVMKKKSLNRVLISFLQYDNPFWNFLMENVSVL